MCRQAYKMGSILYSTPQLSFRRALKLSISGIVIIKSIQVNLIKKMNIFLFFLTILLFGWTFIELIQAYGENVCSRYSFVTYTEQVYEPMSVPYTQKNWFGHYVTKHRIEYQWQPKTKYRYATQYYCCDGYEGSSPHCTPKCEGGCSENRHCVAPNRCGCDDGYSGEDCQPVCHDCGKNSYCVAPHVCRCNAGYRMIGKDNDCVPICRQGCGDHSFCAAPDDCQCEVGYERVSNSSICEPVCTPSCGENSYCKEPDICVCQTGYKLVEDEPQKCQPICASDCGPNSSCQGPDECRCTEGYQLQNGSCQPICSTGCQQHSSCKTPEHCECDEGYHQRGPKNLCEPVCPKGCSAFARCVSPDECQCFPGYEMTEQKCEPKCSEGCPNGYCFTPEVCACSPGYLMGPNKSCEPQCTERCIHGNCTQPEICECEPGYRFAQDSQHICEPICEPQCQNGDCVAPQTCICHLGHVPEDSESGHVCTPSCQVSCVNGTCVSPDTCSCLPGFKPSVEGNAAICQPNCSQGCRNGHCTAPETCQCDEGFASTSDGCQLSITTETDSSSTAAPPLEMSTNCTSGCRCWSELTAADSANPDSNPVKCSNICMDDQEKPCLDLAQCRCNHQTDSRQIICDEAKVFVCQVVTNPKVSPKGDLTVKEAALNSSKTAESAAKWPTILAWCVAICILLVSLTAAIHFYRKRRSQQAVTRRSDELDGICFENDL